MAVLTERLRESAPTPERILDAARAVFAERGFDGASTREIAARAEVNISSLHYHWDSKETLYLAVLERIYQQLVDLVQAELEAAAGSADPVAAVERAMGRTFDFFVEDRTLPKLLMRRLIDPVGPDAERERGVLGPAWRTFMEWVVRFSPGPVAEADLQFFTLAVGSVLLASMLDGTAAHALVGGDLVDPAVRSRLRSRLIDLVKALLHIDGAWNGKGAA